ncbi:DNA polymerase III subunit gamma/tau [Candidatus Dependentiae bacterium]|nr:DNA polymerase III subunit gamma/tau [Candidatus Dependentiae bacterium]
METTQPTINLARRLRPQQFSQIIGQDIPVRMLKNSLYRNKFFPVYLFAGQRGCGKTSTARVFAAAANCDALLAFQQNPTLADIPCLTCASCLAMQRNAHPDFIEIDAASNTGVDNVRQLIETAAYVPLQGRKKVYLIDEAHMLSKAAFNALLKILEEPPMSVLFMLATTELHKIPQTVLSRCFQLSFPALERQAFTNYLQEVCKAESIDIDAAALAVLIQETDGSARDALNLIEQIRFVESPITEASVRKVLGKLSITLLLDLLAATINNNPAQVLTILSSGALHGTNPQATWDLLINAVKTLLWVKYTSKIATDEFVQHQDRFKELAAACSHNRLLAIMQLLWDQEKIFLQTSKKNAFLEFLFLQLAEQDNIASIDELLQGFSPDNQSPQLRYSTPKKAPQEAITSKIATEQPSLEKQPAPSVDKTPEALPKQVTQQGQAINLEWAAFLTKLKTSSSDVVLLAILEQATHKETSPSEITISLRQNSKFFTDKLDEMRSTWFPILQEVLGSITKIHFDQLPVSALPQRAAQPAPKEELPSESFPTPRPKVTQAAANNGNGYAKSFTVATKAKINDFDGEFVSASTALPFASLLISHFPGRLKKLKISNSEAL